MENWPHPVRSEHNNKPVTTSKSWFYTNHECYDYRLVEDTLSFVWTWKEYIGVHEFVHEGIMDSSLDFLWSDFSIV